MTGQWEPQTQMKFTAEWAPHPGWFWVTTKPEGGVFGAPMVGLVRKDGSVSVLRAEYDHENDTWPTETYALHDESVHFGSAVTPLEPGCWEDSE